MDVMIFVYTFIAVFILNIIPFFGPPTWMILAFITLFYKVPSLPLFIFVALCASTLGRFVLASFSKEIVRNKFLGIKHRGNMDYLKKYLEKKPLTISSIFLFEALTPISSDALFVAYGLTGLKMRYALIPFFIGRIFTYSFWVYTSFGISQSLNSLSGVSFFTISAIVTTVILIVLLYFFVKLDWQHLITRKKFKLIS